METDDYLPVSGLQHLLFCRRQCALIHVEGIWRENLLTAEGRVLHDRVHERGVENRPGVSIVRGLYLCSRRLRLTGVSDVVEFHGEGPTAQPYPVEYKRGREKRWSHDEVQLCAQAICLEEMLGVDVPEGALYYGASRRRRQVCFDGELRRLTEDAASEYHEMVRRKETPRAKRGRKCRSCSLLGSCMPDVTASPSRAVRYVAAALRESAGENPS